MIFLIIFLQKLIGWYTVVLAVICFFILILVGINTWLRYQNKKELQFQKQRIAEITSGVMDHNQMLIDGLEYAKYIQTAMMPDEKTLEGYFGQVLLLNFPKTIVSGDFYWSKSFGNVKYLIVADSTGHGIPGGFMSMLGMAYLNQILVSEEIFPNEILEQLRLKIKESLKQYNINDNNDSIDVFCCRINSHLHEFSYAAGNIPGYLVSRGVLTELPAQKITLGFSLRSVNFENVTMTIRTGDRLFLFTDGLPDQFNRQGERFSRRHLLHLFESQAQVAFTELKRVISDDFLNWKADTTQTDDALLVGVEF
jgi:serine phosphatase RsbU (regulator of sigma subunit)